MKVAFYAPLKAPDHPHPSGDRALARAFFRALEVAGHEPFVAARLRSWDGRGDELRQGRIAELGRALADRLVRRWRRDPARAPDAWFTYHVYHKAPDWIGPAVCGALDLPYVVAEASIAPKQRDGPWRVGHAAAADAIRRADAVVCVNPTDVGCVTALRGSDENLVRLPPFLDVDAFVGHRFDARPDVGTPVADAPRLITVAMMRADSKLASYRMLAAALARLRDVPWTLTVVGDGVARREVEAAYAGFERDRIAFVGALPPDRIAALLADADLFVWPAIDEALGLAMLEAQAAGVPVVAGRSPGVASIVTDGRTGVLVPASDATAFASSFAGGHATELASGVASGFASAFADAVRALLADADLRARLGRAAAAQARTRHDLRVAANTLDAAIRRACAAHRERTR